MPRDKKVTPTTANTTTLAAVETATKLATIAKDKLKGVFVRKNKSKKKGSPCSFDDQKCDKVDQAEVELGNDGWEDEIETPMHGDPKEAVQQKNGGFLGWEGSAWEDGAIGLRGEWIGDDER